MKERQERVDRQPIREYPVLVLRVVLKLVVVVVIVVFVVHLVLVHRILAVVHVRLVLAGAGVSSVSNRRLECRHVLVFRLDCRRLGGS